MREPNGTKARSDYEVLIVGGGPAGLSAALVLGRCRRRVLLCDAGGPRNAASPGVYGFLSRDGIQPDELRRVGREQLVRYDTIDVRDALVTDVERTEGCFTASLADGRRVRTQTVLLATGISEDMPPIPGLRPLYGRSVFTCPYCDGFELRGRALAVLGHGDAAVSEARALTRYADDIVLFTNGAADGTDAQAERDLARLPISRRSERVASVEPDGDGIAIVLEGGERVPRAALFLPSPCRQRSPIAERLGCRFGDDGLVETETHQASGVAGLYVAGDASGSLMMAVVAAAEGAAAAVGINRQLLRQEFVA